MTQAGTSSETLPEGYRMTELGLLPKEWRVVRLGEVFSVSPKKQRERVIGENSTYRLITVRLYAKGLVLREEKEGKKIGTKKLYEVRQGDFIFSKIDARNGAWGFVNNNLDGALVSGDFPILSLNRDKADETFIMFFMSRPLVWKILRNIAVGTTNRRRVQPKELLSVIAIPLPPLPEQRAIAHVLRTVQESKETTERVIGAVRELKKSLMRHLFTYGPVPVYQVNQVEMQETEIGPIPAHWRVVRLEEVAEVRGGKRLPKGHKFAEARTPYPYLRVMDFKNASIDTENLKYLTPEDYEILKRYTISARDLYISIAGTIGLVGTIPPELDGANLTENAAKLVIIEEDNLLQAYLVDALMCESCQAQIHQRSTKTSQPKLALSRIRDLSIPLPPLPEQQDIARILQMVDRKIEAEEAKRKALEELFRSLLHELMTARRRLPAQFVTQFEEKAEVES